MKTAAAAFLCFLSSAANATPGGLFEVRLVVECTGGLTAFPLEAPDAIRATELLCVSPDTILTQEDVVKVAKVKRDYFERPVLEITYGKAAQARMFQVTREFIGHRMAIMTNGKMLSAPVIMSPIPGTTVMVSGPTEDIDQLLIDLTNGARPL
jgi:preprotein translocase subunit SecD